MTMLYIHFSGGMGISYVGEIELASLPPELLVRTKHLMLDQLTEKSGKVNSAGVISDDILDTPSDIVPDTMIYEIRHHPSSQGFRVFESQADDEFLDLIDELSDYQLLSQSRLIQNRLIQNRLIQANPE